MKNERDRYIQELMDERAKLRAALEWYADPKNHWPIIKVDEDGGRRAREALGHV